MTSPCPKCKKGKMGWTGNSQTLKCSNRLCGYVNDYSKGESSLINGAALVIEDLDLTNIGLYKEVDPKNPKDYFQSEEKIGSKGVGYFMRKSDKGGKWVTFHTKNLKLPEEN